MPKPTFLNLPEEKRQVFIKIALNEFADHDYHSASVSKIVEKAGIAKGSLYQYFEDKQDLFLYLLEVANQDMLESIRRSPPPDPQAGFFETLRWQMSATVRASVQFPVQSRLARRAYTSPLPFRDKMMEQARKVRGEHFEQMVAQAQSGGELRLDLDPAVAGFMVQGLLGDLGPFLQAKFGTTVSKRGNPAKTRWGIHKADWLELPEVEQVFDQVIQVLKAGLGK
jgi:AcrR family transcriptional regulator